jgi:hypothetical protein
MAASTHSLANIAMFASVLGKVGGEPVPVALVMRAALRRVFRMMPLPPATHGLAGLFRIALYPRATVLTPTFGILYGTARFSRQAASWQ